jgi:hypothetical protein
MPVSHQQIQIIQQTKKPIQTPKPTKQCSSSIPLLCWPWSWPRRCSSPPNRPWAALKFSTESFSAAVAADKAADKVADKEADKAADKAADKEVDKAVDKEEADKVAWAEFSTASLAVVAAVATTVDCSSLLGGCPQAIEFSPKHPKMCHSLHFALGRHSMLPMLQPDFHGHQLRLCHHWPAGLPGWH